MPNKERLTNYFQYLVVCFSAVFSKTFQSRAHVLRSYVLSTITIFLTYPCTLTQRLAYDRTIVVTAIQI